MASENIERNFINGAAFMLEQAPGNPLFRYLKESTQQLTGISTFQFSLKTMSQE